jgi:microcystin-dependent protein
VSGTTAYKGAYLPTVSGDSGTWGNLLNTTTFPVFDANLGGIVTKSISSSNITLSSTESQNAILRLTGTLSANVQVTTLCQGFTIVQNATTGNYLVTFTNGVGAIALVPQGLSTMVHTDPTNGAFVAGARVSTVGQVGMFIGTSAPSGWVKANGALVARSAYPALWTYAQSCGTLATDSNWSSGKLYGQFSSGDGSTTFRLPDLRNYHFRAWADDAAGVLDAGRTAGSFQEQATLAHTHTGTTGGQSADHTHAYDHAAGQDQGPSYGGWCWNGNASRNTGGSSNDHTHSFTTSSSGGTQNIPQNIALMACISYL